VSKLIHQLAQRVVLKAQFVRHLLLRSALDENGSQGFVPPMIDVSGLREVLPRRRVVHDLASRKMSVGDGNNRRSDFTQATNGPADESHESSTKTGMNCDGPIGLPKRPHNLKWSTSTKAD
jgi:hypothetical protein